VTFQGTLAQINAALNGMQFVPTANFSGAAAVAITTNDLGNSGLGGALTDTDSVAVTVTATNDPPVLTVTGAGAQAVSGGTPVLVVADATVVDNDSPNFAGGKITAALVSGGTANDRLMLFGGGGNEITLSGNNVRWNGVNIGTFAGGVGTSQPLVVSLNVNATPEAAAAVIRSLTFATSSANTSVVNRTVRLTVTDGDGGTSNSANVTVAVSLTAGGGNSGVAPTISTPGNPTYVLRSAAVKLSPLAVVTDADGVNFANGKLTVSITKNANANDVLALPSTTVGSARISVVAGRVFFNGIEVGRVSGGAGLHPLVVDFNASATAATVQQIARAVTYRNVSTTLGASTRTVTFSVRDPQGLSASSTVGVNLRA
jgi:hypothetical protein